jgi:hypothetical protein
MYIFANEGWLLDAADLGRFVHSGKGARTEGAIEDLEVKMVLMEQSFQ